MMPQSVKASLLEVQHPDYQYYVDTWRTIEDIRGGATTILKNLNKYLPMRPDEPPALYKLRCAKASFTPVAATAIRELVTKLLSAPMNVSGDDGEFWDDFKKDTNGKGVNSEELLVNIASSLLYFGRVNVVIDRPVVYQPIRSKFEERDYRVIPVVTVYEPLSVTNWGEDWYMTRQIDTVAMPLAPIKYVAKWTIFDARYITQYSAEVKLNGDALAEIWVDGRWMLVDNQNALVQISNVVEHGLGTNPMLSVQLPSEMWAGNNVYSKQLQHFVIESSWTDAGSMAGVIQRVFTPTPPAPQLDERVVYDEPDYSELKTGNQHVLIGADFKFQESSGSAIANLTSQLETIERQVRAIVSMNQSSVSKEALQQSGASKAMEQEPLEDAMLAYGTRISLLYQKILKLVAQLGGQSDKVAVVGLSEYGDDDLTSMLEQANALGMVEAKIPETALKLWYGKLANLLAGSRDADTEAQIQAELDAMDFGAEDDGSGMEDNPENVKKLRQMFGMTEQQAKEVINGKAKR